MKAEEGRKKVEEGRRRQKKVEEGVRRDRAVSLGAIGRSRPSQREEKMPGLQVLGDQVLNHATGTTRVQVHGRAAPTAERLETEFA